MTLVMALKQIPDWIWRPVAGRLEDETLELGDGALFGEDAFDDGPGLLELVGVGGSVGGGEVSPAGIKCKYMTGMTG